VAFGRRARVGEGGLGSQRGFPGVVAGTGGARLSGA